MSRPYILVVEDDEDIRIVVGAALAERFRVVTAATGSEALSAVRVERPDLLLFDWILSDMSGEELVAQLRGIGLDGVRLVTMSGLSGLTALATTVGAFACPKPFTITQILEAIDAALASNASTAKGDGGMAP